MLGLIIILDLVVLTLCIALLVRSGRLTYFHPATVYLFFHILTFTLRLTLIASGAPTLFSDDVSMHLGWRAVTENEIIRAALLADAALFVMTIAWLKAAEDDHRKHLSPAAETQNQSGLLTINRVWPIVILTFVLGIAGIFLKSSVPGLEDDRINLGDWGSSTWIGMLQMWPVIALLILIYWYGFRKSLILLIILFMLLMIYQGYARFRVIIPLIFLTQIYLERHNLKWPPLKIIIILVIGAFLFFPLKTIGKMLQNEAPLADIVSTSANQITNLTNSAFSDLVFMDQFASALTLTDLSKQFYYGRTYLPVLTLAIPRPLWPDKPNSAFYLFEIQTPDRPMATLGMIVTLLGESYLNFGYLGVIIVPFLLAYWLGRFYFSAYRHNYSSATRFFYLITASALLQVYRDGLPSLVLFTLVQYMPVIIIIMLHILFPPRQMTLDQTLSLQAE